MGVALLNASGSSYSSIVVIGNSTCEWYTRWCGVAVEPMRRWGVNPTAQKKPWHFSMEDILSSGAREKYLADQDQAAAMIGICSPGDLRHEHPSCQTPLVNDLTLYELGPSLWWLDQAEIDVTTNDIGHTTFAAAVLNPGTYLGQDTVVDNSYRFVVGVDPNN